MVLPKGFSFGSQEKVIYYKTDSRRLTFREYWNIIGFPRVIFPWICKVLAIPLRLPEGIPGPTPFKEMLVELPTIPEPARQQVGEKLESLRALGFGQSWCFLPKDSLMSGTGYGAMALHHSGQVAAKIVYAKYGTVETLVQGFITKLADGRTILTTDNKPRLLPPSGVDVERLAGASTMVLWKRHSKRMLAASSVSAPIIFANLDHIAAFEDEYSRRNCEFHIARGVWVPMSSDEVEALRRTRATTQRVT